MKFKILPLHIRTVKVQTDDFVSKADLVKWLMDTAKLNTHLLARATFALAVEIEKLKPE